MDDFDLLVRLQLKTMDKLLFVQAEMERYQQMVRESSELENQQQMKDIHSKISYLKEELNKIHSEFNQQTEDLITCFQSRFVSPLKLH